MSVCECECLRARENIDYRFNACNLWPKYYVNTM